jgi:hypothetical protein
VRLLLRIAAIAVGGFALFEAGAVDAALELAPAPAGAAFAALALAVGLALIALALWGTGEGDALAPGSPSLTTAMRVLFFAVSVLALWGLAWLRGLPAAPVDDVTPYHNDAIVLDECAAQTLLRGEDPYARLPFFDCYDARAIGPDRTTPLRAGAFADVAVYPDDAQLDAAWAADERSCRVAGSPRPCEPADLVWRPSYPPLSFVLLAPWVALGWDTNVLYILCLLAAIALILLRASPSLRPFLLTGVLAALSVTAFTVGGSADLLYPLPLVAALLWRERRWSAIALGIAASTKQLAWPFALVYLIQVWTLRGRREAVVRAGITAAIFAVVDAPFVLWDPQAWIAGILTPVAQPMFSRGAGLVILGAGGVLPLFPPLVYSAMEAAAGLVVLVSVWRTRRTSPEIGLVLAMVPLYFAWRSLFSYFFLLPLFAMVGVARMRAGHLSHATVRDTGGLTLLAMPAPEGSPAPT